MLIIRPRHALDEPRRAARACSARARRRRARCSSSSAPSARSCARAVAVVATGSASERHVEARRRARRACRGSTRRARPRRGSRRVRSARAGRRGSGPGATTSTATRGRAPRSCTRPVASPKLLGDRRERRARARRASRRRRTRRAGGTVRRRGRSAGRLRRCCRRPRRRTRRPRRRCRAGRDTGAGARRARVSIGRARSEQREVGIDVAAQRVEIDLDAGDALALGVHLGLGLDLLRDEHADRRARTADRGRAVPGSAAAGRRRRCRRRASPRPRPCGPSPSRQSRSIGPMSVGNSRRTRVRSSRSAATRAAMQLLQLGLDAVLLEAGIVAELDRRCRAAPRAARCASVSPFGCARDDHARRLVDRARRVHPVERLVGLGVGVDRDRAVGLAQDEPRSRARAARRAGLRRSPSSARDEQPHRRSLAHVPVGPMPRERGRRLIGCDARELCVGSALACSTGALRQAGSRSRRSWCCAPRPWRGRSRRRTTAPRPIRGPARELVALMRVGERGAGRRATSSRAPSPAARVPSADERSARSSVARDRGGQCDDRRARRPQLRLHDRGRAGLVHAAARTAGRARVGGGADRGGGGRVRRAPPARGHGRRGPRAVLSGAEHGRGLLPDLGTETESCFSAAGVPLDQRVVRPSGDRDERIARSVHAGAGRQAVEALERSFGRSPASGLP